MKLQNMCGNDQSLTDKSVIMVRAQDADVQSKVSSDSSLSKPASSCHPPPPPPSVPSENPYGPKEPLTSWRMAMVLISIITCRFLQALDQTITATTIAAVTKEFGNFEDVSWIGTIYLLTSIVVMPIYGAAAGMFGRKRVVIFAIVFFMLGSSIAGGAQSMIMLIIGRGIQGFGGGGVISLTKTLISDIAPRRELATYQGYVALTYSVSSTIGPVVGGIMSDHASWRWAYYINFPLGISSILLLTLFLHVKRPKSLTFWQWMATVDYSGIILLATSVVMLLLALNWGADGKYPWNSSVILSLFLVGAVVGFGFLVNEKAVARKPIIPPRLFSTPSLAAGQLCIFIHGFTYLSLVFILPLYFQAVQDVSTVEAGAKLLPLAALGAFMVIITGRLITRFNTIKEFIVAGFFIGTLSSGFLILLNEHSSRLVSIVILIPQGISMGLVINSNLLNIYSELDNYHDIAPATSTWSFLRVCGGTIGMAAASASIQSSLSSTGAEEYANNIRAIHRLEPDVQAPIVGAFVTGMRRHFIVITVLWAIGLGCTFFIQKLPHSREEPRQEAEAEQYNEQGRNSNPA